jgi:uncharacterized heparinase superfamily protein
MEPAIRASNWIAALALVADDAHAEAWFRRALESLLSHGRFIRSHLEGGSQHGNHYLSDIVGLLVLGALFAGPEGQEWLAFSAVELARELDHQILPDGVDHEVSIPYHRLVAELFICGLQVVEALVPERLPAKHRTRIEQVLAFTRDVTRPDGLAPLVGDSDDGRFLPLGDYGNDPRSHAHLFRQAGLSKAEPATSAAYPDGGFYVMRAEEAFLLVRCGPTGVGGQGWHAHNDQLSFELALGAQPLVVDPGSFVYTADPDARNRFRSTRFHSTIAVGGAEQNDLSGVELFRLVDRTQARCQSFAPPVFEGEHHGFRAAGSITHRRRLELAARALLIEDTVHGAIGKELEWTFPLAGGDATVGADGVEAVIGGVRLSFRGDLVWSVEPGWYAPRYGRRIEVPFVRARRTGRASVESVDVTLEFRR